AKSITHEDNQAPEGHRRQTVRDLVKQVSATKRNPCPAFAKCALVVGADHVVPALIHLERHLPSRHHAGEQLADPASQVSKMSGVYSPGKLALKPC
ncbi:hypothetical protein, partial [Sinorhizobium sp. M4_45]|uniref:hypothetical protein n=1 Tax=Sinorhizobium sp. M4_45 TaxID=2037901 RepID=UPI001AECB9FC